MSTWGMQVMVTVLGAAGMIGMLSFGGAEGAPVQSSDSAELHEGQVFPTMVFPSLDGDRPSSVADFRGKKLILHIFASW